MYQSLRKTLRKRRADVWKSLDAQKEAIDLLEKKPVEAAKLIADYFIAEPTLKTLKHGEVAREDVIRDAIKSQTFSAVLTPKEEVRMQEIADILQKQGALKTRDGKPFDVKSITDLSWQKERKL